jgi:mannose-6-phosphate isomerase-like protein (cupin superfamily)
VLKSSPTQSSASEFNTFAVQPSVHQFNQGREFYTSEGCYITELCNSPVDVECSIAQARVAPGVTTRWHRLRDTSERYVILEGRGRVEVGDLSAAEVGPGDVVIIPPNCRQRITNIGSGDLIFLCVCIPGFQVACYEEIAG